jgi:hypothetical protein
MGKPVVLSGIYRTATGCDSELRATNSDLGLGLRSESGARGDADGLSGVPIDSDGEARAAIQ